MGVDSEQLRADAPIFKPSTFFRIRNIQHFVRTALFTTEECVILFIVNFHANAP